MINKPKLTIGRAEYIRFLDQENHWVPAKVDTGADSSSIWASHIVLHDDGTLTFTLFGSKSPYYTGSVISLEPSDYRLATIANSFGVKEERYVVKLRVEVKGRIIKASFSLANRSLKTYPVLLGRRLLKGKFVVDVSMGQSLVDDNITKDQTAN